MGAPQDAGRHVSSFKHTETPRRFARTAGVFFFRCHSEERSDEESFRSSAALIGASLPEGGFGKVKAPPGFPGGAVALPNQ